MKTLTLAASGLHMPSLEDIRLAETRDEYPRESLFFSALKSDRLDERYLLQHSPSAPLLLRRSPLWIQQVGEAYRQRENYDAVISWAEHLAIPFATLLKATGVRYPHVAIFSWVSRAKKALLLKRVHTHIDRMILMSSVQRDFAIREIGVPESKIVFLRWRVDEKFWRPMNMKPTMICSVGREMRDYGTLIKAIRDLQIPCHIAAGGHTVGKKDAWMNDVDKARPFPSHITFGSKNFVELRELYAHSHFMVMPLLDTDTDNGATSILEAMAMGKAIICSRTAGQVDLVQEGKTGIYVPPGDPRALRNAIQHLWDNPDVARKMGLEARNFIDSYYSIDGFVNSIRQVVQDVIEEHQQREA